MGKSKKEMAAELAGKIINHANDLGIPLQKKKTKQSKKAK